MKKRLEILNTTKILSGVLLLILMSSCAENVPLDQCLTGKTYGFFWGIWHGIIAPISLVISLFDKDVAMFAMNNTGFLYGLGFLIGSGGWGILASNAKKD
ncbi:hypothetical protein MMU07_08670 [Aquiflexum sp. LQ15W]|uniref:hypothetical protein n=1 Tax=Cognataquiflexum nitidum TaxID=2922272 RepID=UPI001F12A351|nr:hypothetical protein [Cognataquiflexum nitidum]MCH6199650.1 hypothetical protein [Cognataquiflexum nitidum]